MSDKNSTNDAWSEPTAFSWDVVVIGTSAGGSRALAAILPRLSEDYAAPVIVVQHLHPHQDSAAFVVGHQKQCALKLVEAQDKMPVRPGAIYFAPPNYHLLIEDGQTFALSIDDRINFTRPSIDVLFESAAHVYAPHLIGIILTGANQDGARGLSMIREVGGITVVQAPETAEVSYMPSAALAATDVDYVLPLRQIGALLTKGCPQRKPTA